MSDLKACPFCGEEIYSEFYSHRAEEFDGHCTNKKCVLYGKELLFFNTARWNTRPIEDQLRAENERLKGVLQSMFDRCLLADEQGELSELISGELLDSVGTLLGYTPENAEKKNKETEKNILQFLNSLKGE